MDLDSEPSASPQLLSRPPGLFLGAPEALLLCLPAWSIRCPLAPGALLTAPEHTGVLGSGRFSYSSEWMKMNSVSRVEFTPWKRLPDVCPSVLSTAGGLLPRDPEAGEHFARAAGCSRLWQRGQPGPEQPLCFVLQADHPRRVPHAPGGLPNGRARLPPEIWEL